MKTVNLNVHSDYSVTDSILKVKEIVDLAKKNEQESVAIVDITNLSSLVKFYTYANEQGVKPIIGSTLFVEDGFGIFEVVVLCKNNTGYLNLSELISKSFKDNQKNEKAITKIEWLLEKNEGLIVLSGYKSDIARAKNVDQFKELLSPWVAAFGDRYYIELTRTGREGEKFFGDLVLSSQELDVPVVASNPSVFSSREDFEAHDVRVCVNEGALLEEADRVQKYTNEQYFKGNKELSVLFEDVPGALENTIEISKRCNVTLTLGTYFLPEFPVPEGHTIDSYFEESAKKGLEERLNFLYPNLSTEEFNEKRKAYDDRLEYEIKVILQMKFPGYFFIVADFIQWSKNNGIPVGPGRGSGAGSLVAYSLKITDLDPLQYDLLFERFLNPERVSMPDFDVDFCMERRDEVIKYVTEHYGHEQVSQIITFGTMSAKSVIRDVGRVLGGGYGFVDSIAKLVPNDLGIKLKDAIENEIELKNRYNSEEETRRILDLALKLEGTIRNAGKHAGGIVIGPKPLYNFCPTSCEEDGSSVVTQLDKNDVETAGLVKFDFLGLRTLTIVDWALKDINKNKSPDERLDILAIPLDDPETLEMIKTGDTTGVFQLESHGMQNLIKKLKPDCFEDIIALVALFRPGPLESGMVDNFIARKHGKEEISYPDKDYQHMSLKTILEPTYGVILYQEQVMQIAQVLAGYTLGEADLLRRAMGKKKPEEMAKQRSIFKEGAIKNGVDGELAMRIFDLVEKFAGYGFNKSHSAAYALISYQSAWLKVHYPVEFMAAQISSDMDNTEKVVHMVKEAQKLGIEILPPDINASESKFRPAKDFSIRYGLEAIKGVGGAILDAIIKEKTLNGNFTSFFNYCERVRTGKRVLKYLIDSGSMDSFSRNRRSLAESISLAQKNSDQQNKNKLNGQIDLFGDGEFAEINLIKTPEFHSVTKFLSERLSLGMFLTGHPLDDLNTQKYQNISLLRPQRNTPKTAAGIIVESKRVVTKNGDMMIILDLSDQTGEISVILRGGMIDIDPAIIKKGEIVVVDGEVSKDFFNGGLKIDADSIKRFSDQASFIQVDDIMKEMIMDFDSYKTNGERGTKLFFKNYGKFSQSGYNCTIDFIKELDDKKINFNLCFEEDNYPPEYYRGY